jgi:hypothetical protein
MRETAERSRTEEISEEEYQLLKKGLLREVTKQMELSSALVDETVSRLSTIFPQ